MTIPLIKEDREELLKWGRAVADTIERCHFCQTPTRYWHENTNNPVCPECAPKHKVAELPDFGHEVRKAKRLKRKNLRLK